MTKSSLDQIIQALNGAHVRYMVVGGIAVAAHGYVRSTNDVDLIIQLDEPNLLNGLRALGALGYRPHIPVTFEDFASASNRARWIVEKQMKVLKLFCDAHRETPIDIFADDPLGFDQAYLRARYFRLADNLDVPVCSYED